MQVVCICCVDLLLYIISHNKPVQLKHKVSSIAFSDDTVIRNIVIVDMSAVCIRVGVRSTTRGYNVVSEKLLKYEL